MEPSVGGPWERVGLGSTSTTLSRVGLGLHATGNLPPDRDAQAHDLIRHAFDVGINLIDTAPVYGAGSAERRLGDALAGLDRRSVVISTKVGYLLRPRRMGPTIRRILWADLTNGGVGYADLWRRVRGAPSELARLRRDDDGQGTTGDARRLGSLVDFTYDGAMRSVEESLARLRVDHIDLALLRVPSPSVDGGPADRTVQAPVGAPNSVRAPRRRRLTGMTCEH